MARDKSSEGTTRADGAELAVVTDEYQLGSGLLDVGGETHEVGIVGHPDLVADHHCPVAHAQLAMVEAP